MRTGAAAPVRAIDIDRARRSTSIVVRRRHRRRVTTTSSSPTIDVDRCRHRIDGERIDVDAHDDRRRSSSNDRCDRSSDVDVDVTRRTTSFVVRDRRRSRASSTSTTLDERCRSSTNDRRRSFERGGCPLAASGGSRASRGTRDPPSEGGLLDVEQGGVRGVEGPRTWWPPTPLPGVGGYPRGPVGDPLPGGRKGPPPRGPPTEEEEGRVPSFPRTSLSLRPRVPPPLPGGGLVSPIDHPREVGTSLPWGLGGTPSPGWSRRGLDPLLEGGR